MAMRILITGGAGYAGSHVCKAVASGGHLRAVDDTLARGPRAAVRWGAMETGDLADRARLRDVIARHRPDGVMHLAAFAYVGESVAHPDLYYANNLMGTLSLLEVMRELRLQALVFSSSCAVYGTPAQLPLRED